jgi:hypothetical protein
VLTQLIDRKAIEAEAVRRGLKVTDTEVVEFIRHIPAFRENGQFVGSARYRAVLRAQRPPLREEDFEADVRTDLLAQKLQAAVTSWVTVSEAETDAEYRRRNEKVKLEVVGFTADGNAQHVEHRPVEALARREILDHELEMIDETAAMQFLGVHGVLLFRPNLTSRTGVPVSEPITGCATVFPPRGPAAHDRLRPIRGAYLATRSNR